jgi:hypothetical protein
MAISDEQLKAITDAEIRSSIAYLGGKLSEYRRRNEYYYLGLAKGELAPPTIAGRSQAVSTDVADTVEWMLPGLLKIFAAGENAVEFAPQGPEDERAAQQATDFVNYVFHRQNPGFQILYTWFKDALIQKAGIVKVWWDKRIDETREEYDNQTLLQVQMLLQDPDVELIEKRVVANDAAEESAEGASSNPAEEAGEPTFNITIKRRNGRGQVRVEPVPPEEFLISRKAKSITDAPFVAHRVERSLSDLRAQGYSNLDGIGSDDTSAASSNAERLERRSFDDEQAYMPMESGGPNEPSQKTVWVTECYLRVDYDGDGISEWRKVVRAGNALLANETCDGPPFVSIVPIPLPHRFFGLCPADLAVPSQQVKTSLKRAVLDNLYLQVNGRYFAVEQQVNLDDLLTSRPGGVVRVKDPTAVGPLQSGQGDIRGTMQFLEYEEVQKENRTGFTRYSQGGSADSLNKTATGVSIITNRADSRVELIARVFAETGVRDLFRMILKLVSKYQDRATMIRLGNSWVPMDPREWKTQFDVTVNVGLGTGNKDQIVQHLMVLAQAQEKAMAMGIATPKNFFNGLTEIARNMGFRSPEKYFTDPGDRPMQPPPDPRLQFEQTKLQAEIQAKQADLQAHIQLEQFKIQKQFELDQWKAGLEAETRARVEQIRLSARSAATEAAQLAGAQASREAQVPVIETAIEALGPVIGRVQELSAQVQNMAKPKAFRVVRNPDGSKTFHQVQ